MIDAPPRPDLRIRRWTATSKVFTGGMGALALALREVSSMPRLRAATEPMRPVL